MIENIYVKTKSELAKNLSTIRKNLDITQQEVAEAIGFERSTYSYYEIGKTTPDIFTLLRISEIFGVDIYYLIHKNGPIILRPFMECKKIRVRKK